MSNEHGSYSGVVDIARNGIDEVIRLRALNAELVAENEALRTDAERYRFIRDADRSDCITHELSIYAMESLDEYVDAAMEDEARLDAARGKAEART